MSVFLHTDLEHRVRVDDLAFPEKLLEAMGPRAVVAPEVNPVARQESVRWINGLPRHNRTPDWFARPPPSQSREAGLDAFIAGVDRTTASEAELRLLALLEARRTELRAIRAALARNALSTSEP